MKNHRESGKRQRHPAIAGAWLCVFALTSAGLTWGQQSLTPAVTLIPDAQQPVTTPMMAESDLYLMNATVGQAVTAQGNYANLQAILGAIGLGFAAKVTEPEALPNANQGKSQNVERAVRPQVRATSDSSFASPGLHFVPGVGYVNQDVATASMVAAAPTNSIPENPISPSISLPNYGNGVDVSTRLPVTGLSVPSKTATGIGAGSSGSLNAVGPTATPHNALSGSVKSPTSYAGISPSLLKSQRMAAKVAQQGAATDMSLSTPAGMSGMSVTSQSRAASNPCSGSDSLVTPQSAACIVSPLTSAMYPSAYRSGESQTRKDYEKSQCIELAKKMLKAGKAEQMRHASELSACKDDLERLEKQKGGSSKQ